MAAEHGPEFKVSQEVLNKMRQLNQEYSEVENRLIGRDETKDQFKMAALSLLQKNEKDIVEVVELNILDSGCVEIAQALSANTKCTILRLREVGMTGPGAIAVTDAVSKRPQLRELYLDDNDLSSKEAIGAVASLIAKNTPLKVLGLDSNKIEADGMKVICQALGSNTNLEVLLLSDNFFGDRGVTELVKVLQTTNKTVQRIKLANDEISIVGAQQLASFMASNACALREVDFSGNHLITTDGLKQVQDTLRLSNFEESDALAYRKKGQSRRAVPPAANDTTLPSSPPTAKPDRPTAVVRSNNHSWFLFGLMALAIGGGLFLLSRRKFDKKND